MSDPHDALARFRAVTDAAVEQGRRAVREAGESGAAFDRHTRRLAERRREHGPDPDQTPTSPDLRAAAREFRLGAGLPVPEPDPDGPEIPSAASTAEDEDFSLKKIMYKL